jgi:hypothetical protein
MFSGIRASVFSGIARKVEDLTTQSPRKIES